MNLFSFLLITAFAVYAVFVEYLDWHGRMDVLQDKHPLLWKAVNARAFRLVLLLLIFGMLAHQFEEQPLVIQLNAVPSPDAGARNAEIARLQQELAVSRIERTTGTAKSLGSRPSHMFYVKASIDGNFTVKHGAGCKPALVHPVMTSGGNFWFQTPTQWDEKNVYLVSSGQGVTAKMLVWCP